MFAMQALQDNPLQNVKKLGSEISDIEVIEDKIRTFYEGISSLQQLFGRSEGLATQGPTYTDSLPAIGELSHAVQ